MEVKDAILKRRSVRNYEKKEVKSWVIGELLESARHAPSAGNAQNWRFVVVRSPDVKSKVAGACSRQYWMTTAPVFIVICSDESKTKTLYKKRADKYTTENCATAASFIMLRAVDFDLGTCWVGAFDEYKVGTILGLEKEMVPKVILTVGYPKKSELAKPHIRHNLDKLVFFEKFKNRSSKPPMRLTDYVKKGISKIKKKK